MVRESKRCAACAHVFITNMKEKQFCSSRCRNKYTYDKKKKVKYIDRKCLECNKLFTTSENRNQKCCGIECSRKRNKRIYSEINPVLPICTGTIGAIGEYRVVVDLLFKGFDVFKSMSPHCPCDLVIGLNNKTYRVEVTTGSILPSGKIQNNKIYGDCSKFDIVAIVLKSGEVFYEPELPF
jgi:hypothetical protein